MEVLDQDARIPESGVDPMGGLGLATEQDEVGVARPGRYSVHGGKPREEDFPIPENSSNLPFEDVDIP